MYKLTGDSLAATVREMLILADALGLSETSIHLNAALITLDGRGFAPGEEEVEISVH